MPVLLDAISLELGWDVKKFLEGAKETEAQVGKLREGVERHGKIFENAIGSMVRQISALVAAFFSIEAAVAAFASTKDVSRVGTEFSNLAEAVGLSVTELGAWEQALVRVGGRYGEASAAFKFQQQELMKMKGPGGTGAPSFLAFSQQLGLGDLNKYFNPATGSFDTVKMNLDIEKAMRVQNFSPEKRAQFLKEFGWNSDSAQRW